MSPRQRLLLSFVVSPLAAFPVTASVFQLWSLVHRMTSGKTIGPGDLDNGVFFGLAALLVAYPVMLILGIPISLALRKLKLFRLRVMVYAGGLAGAIPFLPVTVSATRALNPDLLSTAGLNLVAGVLSGAATAWLVWRISTGAQSRSTPPGNNTERRTDMLTVLYDGRCVVCRRARAWLETQSKYVPLEYVAAGSQEARSRFPGLDHDNTLVDLTVVSFNGEVYHGAKAWIMCLWALKKYRGTALRLATPELMPTAKRVIAWVSRNRFNIGQSPAWKT